MIKFIELFAGIGGFRYGLESIKCDKLQPMCRERNKGEENSRYNEQSRSKSINQYKAISYKCVWANEWDKYAAKIYRKNFGEGELIEGDIRTITAGEIPDHDLLCAGFPCQAFSIAGKRKGFEDTRGTLFYDIARILDTKKPRYLLLENVKGLLSHDNGITFRTILWVLSELGYDLQWQILNSKFFGVPQNRERVFIIGHTRGTSRPEVFPIRGRNETIKQNNECNERPSVYFDDSIPKATTRRGRVMDKAGALMANPRGGIAINEEKFSQFKASNISQSVKVGGDVGRCYYGMKIRRLTPIECERLQGFPDDWTKGISDTQRYKCLGNAVTTNVITEIGKRLV